MFLYTCVINTLKIPLKYLKFYLSHKSIHLNTEYVILQRNKHIYYAKVSYTYLHKQKLLTDVVYLLSYIEHQTLSKRGCGENITT